MYGGQVVCIYVCGVSVRVLLDWGDGRERVIYEGWGGIDRGGYVCNQGWLSVWWGPRGGD